MDEAAYAEGSCLHTELLQAPPGSPDPFKEQYDSILIIYSLCAIAVRKLCHRDVLFRHIYVNDLEMELE